MVISRALRNSWQCVRHLIKTPTSGSVDCYRCVASNYALARATALPPPQQFCTINSLDVEVKTCPLTLP